MADAIAITGPTAAGKTVLAVAVAQRLHGEIISFDSRQVYRGMDIGTAKPTLEARGGVPHHGFDLVEPDERFNAGRFAALARDWTADSQARGRTPVLVGGTGFFLRALTHPLFEEPELDPARKEAWKKYLATVPTAELARWAALLDPGASVRPADRQRLARVIETAQLTGRPLSWWQRQAPPHRPAAPLLVVVLDLPRDELYRRIDERVDAMVRAGLVDEVRALLARGYSERDPGMNATGYVEMVPYLRGEYDLAHAVELIARATRRYARRQITWLRHQLPPGALWLDGMLPAGRLADDIAQRWLAASATRT
ncbi:MAG TPA: tRNA (adenosine(37)-N6)-dimethylallyltransferase MiaA [Longimicrobiales bacterium]|nr:tRNA (adenosine(37)-N6)-dimethylallyltransferase MiaA [Longimicrobiales bacterium]